MHFTREPIIETVITPKEGYKLVVRSSRQGRTEEFSVDAVEVVSFGSALFYRSLERPKPFIVPVSEFEITESKVARVSLKKAKIDKAIKIGGGKQTTENAPVQEEVAEEKKPEKKRTRTRRERKAPTPPPLPTDGEEAAPPPPPRKMIPPPTALISEHLDRYKNFLVTKDEETPEQDTLPIDQPKREEQPPELPPAEPTEQQEQEADFFEGKEEILSPEQSDS